MRKQIEAAEKMRLALEAQLAALRQELCKSKADMDAMKAMYESKLAALQAEIKGAVTLCTGVLSLLLSDFILLLPCRCCCVEYVERVILIEDGDW